MGRLGVILGSSATGPRADLAARVSGLGATAIQRHADGEGYVLPHRIDHEANLRPLAEQGVDRVLAISSVGSLKPQLPVGTLVCPDDFIALHLDHSVFADPRAHSAPGFDQELRAEAIAAWAAGGQEPVDGGVYWQAIGPRFETPAEIRLMAAHAEVVGMTVGAECVVAGELGLAYAALCMVDNLANGLGPARLSVPELERDRAANAVLLRDGLEAVLPRLGAVGR